MKVDLNYVFKDLYGTEIKSPPLEGEKEGRAFTLKDACANALLGIFRGEENLSGVDKATRYQLAMKIHSSDGQIDLSVDDLKLLKDLIGKNPSPLIVGQAYKILDPIDRE